MLCLFCLKKLYAEAPQFSHDGVLAVQGLADVSRLHDEGMTSAKSMRCFLYQVA